MKEIITHSPEETQAFAREFARGLNPNDVVGLAGNLGGGKTTFVQGLFEGLEGDPSHFVSSPTFTLLQEYPTRRGMLYHFDLYRLGSYGEFENLDFEEYFDCRGFCLVEWADKFKELKENLSYLIRFEYEDELKRRLIIEKLK